MIKSGYGGACGAHEENRNSFHAGIASAVGAPTIRTPATEPQRYPLGVYWSDEGHRLTLIDTRLDSAGFSDCRLRDLSVSANGLTVLRTVNLDQATYCAFPDDDTPIVDYIRDQHAAAGGGGGGGGGAMAGAIRRDTRRKAPARGEVLAALLRRLQGDRRQNTSTSALF